MNFFYAVSSLPLLVAAGLWALTVGQDGSSDLPQFHFQFSSYSRSVRMASPPIIFTVVIRWKYQRSCVRTDEDAMPALTQMYSQGLDL